jgi:hypothetical protein
MNLKGINPGENHDKQMKTRTRAVKNIRRKKITIPY